MNIRKQQANTENGLSAMKDRPSLYHAYLGEERGIVRFVCSLFSIDFDKHFCK